MSAKPRGLGRGLDALLPKVEKGNVQQVPATDLHVSSFQPRTTFDDAALAELSSSIADKGVLQPLLVRERAEGGYEIVAGERRFRASKLAGLDRIPVIVRDLDDQATLEIAIIENLQREDLNPVEEARAFKQLLDFGLSQEGVAKAVGKSRSTVANTLRLLTLPDEALVALERNEITAGHARAILAQPSDDRLWALDQIQRRDLTVREAERLQRHRPAPKEPEAEGDLRRLEEDLARHAGTRVRIRRGRGKRGRIELHYHSEEEMERLLELLGYQA